MNWFNISLLFHIVGVGMIFTVLCAGPVVESNFRWENDVRMKLHSAKLLRNIGLLSPFGALVLVVSGIGNMVILGITFGDLFWSTAWLGMKILLFILLLALGMVVSPKTARRRMALLELLSQPNSPEDIDDQMDSLNRRQTIFFVANWALVLLILLLTLFKP
jgi:uncharacterized membrane protein SirB2